MSDHTPPTETTDPDRGNPDPADPERGHPGYADALAELDGILRELESSDVDVDRLGDRVARAAELISVCRERIDRARLRIDQVIAELDGDDDDAPNGADSGGDGRADGQ